MSYRTSNSNRQSVRTFVVSLLTYAMLTIQLAPMAIAANSSAVRGTPTETSDVSGKSSSEQNQFAPVPAPVPMPTVPAGGPPNIVATKTDNRTPAQPAAPGDTINYTVTISNTGLTAATGVTFNDTIDANTTLVGGSIVSTPLANPDTYNVIGNVRIQPNAAQGLLTNDFNPDNGDNTGITASGPATTTQNGNLTISADGSFSYNPAPGFTGTDTFTYTLTVTATGKTDTATVTLLVGNGTATPGTSVIWFIDDNATPGGDGRLTTPFNCFVGAGCFSATTSDDPGDTIFLFNGAYTAGYSFLANQKLIGQGAGATLASLAGVTVPTASDALPVTNGNPDNVTMTTAIAATNALNVNSGGIVLRGFTIGNTTGAKIFGNNFGTLTAGDITTPDLKLTGSGQALSLTTGAFAPTSAFTSVVTTSSPTQGINLAGVTGTVAFNGTQVSGSTTQGILIGTTTADINFGNTTVSAGTDAVSFQNNSSGTRTFGTLTATAGGAGNAFLHGVGGGNVTANNLATLTSGAGNTIDIGGSTAGTTVNFAGGATLTKTAGGTGVNLLNDNGNVTFGGTLTIGTSGARFPSTAVTISGGTGTYSLGAVSIFTNGFAGITATNADGTMNVTSGTVDVNAATALNIDGPAGITTLGMTLTTVNSTGGTNNVNLADVGGSLTIQGGTLSGATAAAFAATTTTATVSCAASITNATGGISLTNNTGGTFTFSGGINLSTGANPAFTATGGGTVNATQNNTTIVNTLTTTSGAALNVANTTIGVSGLTFRSISANGATNGIVLNNTGATGGLTVSGNGGACSSVGTCTGGTIQTATVGVSLTNTRNVSIDRMLIQTTTDSGINGTQVTNFSFTNGKIDNSGNAAFESNIAFNTNPTTASNIAGTLTLTGNTLTNAFYSGLDIQAGDGTITNANISSNVITSTTSVATSVGFGININGVGTTTTAFALNNATITSNAITNFPTASGIQINGGNANATGPRGTIGIPGDPSNIVSITGNTIQGQSIANRMGGSAIIVAVIGGNNTNATTRSRANINISSNPTLTNIAGTVIGVGCNGHTTMTATVNNNVIVANQQANFGGANGIGGGDGIGGGGAAWTPALTMTVTGNNISQTDGNGILLVNRATNGTMDLKITGNTVGAPINAGGTARQGIRVDSGNNTAGEDTTVCVTISGNTSAGSNGGAGIGIRKQGVVVGTDDFGITGLAPSPATGAQAAAFVASQNPAGGGCDNISGSNFVSCVSAPPIAPPADEAAMNMEPASGTTATVATQLDVPTVVAIEATATERNQTSERDNVQRFNHARSKRLVNASSQKTSLAIANTSRPFIAMTQTPLAEATSSLFLSRSTYREWLNKDVSWIQTDAALLGQEPSTQTKSGDAKLPAKDGNAKKPITPKGITPLVANFPLTIGTLQPSKSVTITFSVTVNNPLPGGVTQVSNQGTVSGSNFSSVLTDDPDVVGTNNPTVTQITGPPDIFARDARAPEPPSGTANMLFTVALSSPAPGPVSVNYATADGGGNPATGGTCAGGADYETTSGTVNFLAGQRLKIVPVVVCSDATVETDETLLLNLSGAVGGNIVDAQAVGTITAANTPGDGLISEVRTSGPSGAGDDFVELYNNSNSPVTVAADDASPGVGLFKLGADCSATPVLIGTIPNGTVIPARGHYLFVGSSYSLGAYASGDATLTADIENDSNLGFFSTTDPGNLSTDTRLDAVGFGANTGGVCDLLREGNTLPPVAGSTTQYSFFRKQLTGLPQDTNDNASDFQFADTSGTFIAGVTQQLGAPGPENATAPIQRNATIKATLIDPQQPAGTAPNRVRDFTSNPGNNSTFGTLDIRRKFTNNTGGAVTRLRFRVTDITTFPSPGAGTADLRPITSGPITVTITGGAMITVQGTTLEQPPSQPFGGGLNSTVAAGTITLGTPLANGANINVRFLLGVQQAGAFRFFVNVEALP